MALPELRVVAEGETSRGEHWYLTAGLAFFAILLPWTTMRLVGLQGFDASGQPVK